MMGRTHCLVPAAIAGWVFGPDMGCLFAAAAGGLLPDVDEPESTLGNRIWLLSRGLKGWVGHRTLTHSFMGLCVGMLSLLIYGMRPEWILAVLIGWTSHIVLDAMSGGVPLWWPMYKKHRWILGRLHPFGIVDNLLLIGAGAGLAFAAIDGNWLGWWLEMLRQDTMHVVTPY